jgi:hypothetical protein
MRLIGADNGPPGCDEFAHAVLGRDYRLELAAEVLDCRRSECAALPLRLLPPVRRSPRTK